MRFYVASLSDYNAGRLHGTWIDATGDVDEMQQQIDDMLSQSKESVAEEWAVHDYDGAPLSLSEHPDLCDIARIATMTEEHGEDIVRAAGSISATVDELQEYCERYLGRYDTPSDWAYELLEGTGELSALPERLAAYFDYESYARDCELGGDVCFVRVAGRYYVFGNH